jgi:hypothetical protein
MRLVREARHQLEGVGVAKQEGLAGRLGEEAVVEATAEPETSASAVEAQSGHEDQLGFGQRRDRRGGLRLTDTKARRLEGGEVGDLVEDERRFVRHAREEEAFAFEERE